MIPTQIKNIHFEKIIALQIWQLIGKREHQVLLKNDNLKSRLNFSCYGLIYSSILLIRRTG